MPANYKGQKLGRKILYVKKNDFERFKVRREDLVC
jgi:hypothetical protein